MPSTYNSAWPSGLAGKLKSEKEVSCNEICYKIEKFAKKKKYQEDPQMCKRQLRFAFSIILQLNLSNTDTEGTEQSVRIREVSVV